jgi:hypothetical protein
MSVGVVWCKDGTGNLPLRGFGTWRSFVRNFGKTSHLQCDWLE